MDSLKNFEQYAAWLRTVYEEDPLLMLANHTNLDAPKDNELIVLSASPNELERMIMEMGFVPKPDTAPSERTHQGNPWTREPITISSKAYLLVGGLTTLYAGTVNKPIIAGIHEDEESLSFMGMGNKVGEMTIHTQLTLHPYNRGSDKSIPDEQYAAMKEVYAHLAQKRIGDRNVKELLQDTYFRDSYRIFADEFLAVMEHLSRQNCQAAFQHGKAPQLIAAHNVLV